MPTAAKLVAAIFFAALGWLAGEIFGHLLPPEVQHGLLNPVAALLGAIAGWRVSGRLVGKGWTEAATNGVRTAITAGFMVTFIFSTYDMITRALKRLYDGPMPAVLDIFNIMLTYGRMMLATNFVATVVVGGVIGGLITEWASRRWR